MAKLRNVAVVAFSQAPIVARDEHRIASEILYPEVRSALDECDTALVCGYGKNSEGEPERVLNLELDPYYQAPLGLGPSATAALQASAYMARTGAADRDLAEVAARNRAAGAKNACAQLREAVPAE